LRIPPSVEEAVGQKYEKNEKGNWVKDS